jgi:hypothetical protein
MQSLTRTTPTPIHALARSMWMALLLSTIGVLSAVPTPAQDVVVDWSTQKVVSSPGEVQKGSPLKVQVINVNDILYEYSVGVQVTTDSADDFALLKDLLPLSTATPAARMAAKTNQDPCVSQFADALDTTKSIKDELESPGKAFNPEDKPGHYIQIKLSSTLRSWNATILPYYAQLQADVAILSKCPAATYPDANDFVTKKYPPVTASIEAIQKKVDGKHSAEGQAPASTGDVVSAVITVSEKWKGKETSKDPNLSSPSPYTVTLAFSSNLRLSAGVLFSQLEDRSYVSRTVPSAQGTANILGVNGDSKLTPYLVGLLNYRLPLPEVKNFNLWISSGPTLRITNTGGNTSAFGFFGGASVSLWNRLFITPGIHFGQFAGVPAGLSVGQTIPANFGQLQPINRWSARFGFSITYKTLSLGALTKSSAKNTATTNTNSQQPAKP